ncbi:glycerate kinase [Curtobacterium sp. VKM Ac-2865]|uniref:glycerate kinase n=1 Tax=Curtobacterium sp. VKM Ac-2865 TaxID=2783817 RepID=UPI00188A9C03|nr:glycerate kinase [Curtobacterium sp. VKM Ac-2865]MBF4583764.1 glycerate kinase [Curtobacterium sp. VKM Ac-2865]
MHVVVAPDSFKGTATAAAVAAAIGDGWLAARPDDTVTLLPMADGGEGTLDAFAAAVPGSRRVPVRVTGPAGAPVDAEWLALPDGRAVVELAVTSGLPLLSTLEPDAAQTTGFGEAIAAALDAGATGLVLGIGGSASTDGGAGLLGALGLGGVGASDGSPLGAGGGSLLDGLDGLGALTTSTLRPLPPLGVTVLTDVTSPLLGPTGAAAVFGPQKGVTPDRVPVHEARLAAWAARFPDVDPTTPGAGAAGGAGFGLLVWGATLARGAGAVAAVLGLPDVVATADVVVTGEGRFDGQSAAGKVASVVCAMAEGRRRMLVAGAIDAPVDDFDAAASLTVIATQTTGEPSDAMTDPLRFARIAGQRLAARA